MTAVDTLLSMRRFAGATIDYRRDAGWPAPCRANLYTSKNERSAYRLERFGATAEEAAQAVLDEVARLDGEPGASSGYEGETP